MNFQILENTRTVQRKIWGEYKENSRNLISQLLLIVEPIKNFKYWLLVFKAPALGRSIVGKISFDDKCLKCSTLESSLSFSSSFYNCHTFDFGKTFSYSQYLISPLSVFLDRWTPRRNISFGDILCQRAITAETNLGCSRFLDYSAKSATCISLWNFWHKFLCYKINGFHVIKTSLKICIN